MGEAMTGGLHAMLEALYDDMLDLCQDMIGVSTAIAGLGGLLYISYRVWGSIARAESIDVFPLLRPFAISILIMFFPSLVMGTINGILSPVSKATSELVKHQFHLVEAFDERKQHIIDREMEELQYFEDGDTFDEEFHELIDDEEAAATIASMKGEKKERGMLAWLKRFFMWLLEVFFFAATVLIDVLRTFYMILLTILGPLVFAIAVYDGFQSGVSQWLAKYIAIYLWLPIMDIFMVILIRVQYFAATHEIQFAEVSGEVSTALGYMLYMVFLIVGILGVFTVPSISNWVVQTGGFGNVNRGANSAGSSVLRAAGRGALLTATLPGRAFNDYMKHREAKKERGDDLSNSSD